MEDSKHWYQSSGAIGGIVTIILAGLAMFGVGVPEAEKETIIKFALEFATLIAGVTSLIGRLRATKKIK